MLEKKFSVSNIVSAKKKKYSVHTSVQNVNIYLQEQNEKIILKWSGTFCPFVSCSRQSVGWVPQSVQCAVQSKRRSRRLSLLMKTNHETSGCLTTQHRSNNVKNLSNYHLNGLKQTYYMLSASVIFPFIGRVDWQSGVVGHRCGHCL